MNSLPRIVSLIPSATEIVAALEMTDRLVGCSHECDYPPDVVGKPVCTEPKFDPEGTSAEIHDRVTHLLQSALSVYRVKTELLAQLKPTHILTQAQCDVCAVSLADVEKAVATLTGCQPQIISLQPTVLADVWLNMWQVAVSLSIADHSSSDYLPPDPRVKATAKQAIFALKARVDACEHITQSLTQRPTVACIEWTDPLMAAGNWVPELVTLAGGTSLFGTIGQHSDWLQPEALVEADPDVIIVMPCGFDLARTEQETNLLLQRPDWQALKAVRTGKVYATDGNQYFNRPGPRLVDSLEILAEILHPDLFHFGYHGSGWRSALSNNLYRFDSSPSRSA